MVSQKKARDVELHFLAYSLFADALINRPNVDYFADEHKRIMVGDPSGALQSFMKYRERSSRCRLL